MDDDGIPLIIQQRSYTKYRITVEPVAFLYFSAYIIQSIVNQDIYLKKICLINFNLNANQCTPHANQSFESDTDHSADIQRYMNNLNIYASLIENIPSIFIVLFLGPWSDRKGRKVPMMMPMTGHLLGVILFIINYYVESWPAEYLLFASIPVGLCGGSTTLIMALNSFMADITDSESRTSRLSILYGSIAVAFPVTSFLSIYVYRYGGYLAIWGTSMGLAALAFLYIAFFITDHRQQNKLINQQAETEADDTPLRSSGCLSVIINLWECFTVTFQPRNGFKRACLSIMLASMCLFIASSMPTSVSYLYAKKVFGWDQPQYALLSTIGSLTTVFGSFVLLPLLSSYFKVNDCLLGIIAIFINMAGYLSLAFVRSSFMVYLSTTGYILMSSIGVVIRSMISKIVLNDELSHVYSVLASFESIIPLISVSTYNLIYKATLEVFPGCVYVTASGFLLAILILFFVVLLLQWKEKNDPVFYNHLEEEPANNTSLSN